MQLPAPFEYERATSVDHAIALLERHGPEARLIAGGHSLLPMMKLRLARPEVLIDVNDLTDLAGISIAGGELRIGASSGTPTSWHHWWPSTCACCTTPSGSSPIRSCATGARSAARCARPIRPRTCRPPSPPCTPRSSSGALAASGSWRRGNCTPGRTRRRSGRPRCSPRCGCPSDRAPAAPTRRWSGAPATGRWPPREWRCGSRATPSPTSASGSPPSGRPTSTHPPPRTPCAVRP